MLDRYQRRGFAIWKQMPNFNYYFNGGNLHCLTLTMFLSWKVSTFFLFLESKKELQTQFAVNHNLRPHQKILIEVKIWGVHGC